MGIMVRFLSGWHGIVRERIVSLMDEVAEAQAIKDLRR